MKKPLVNAHDRRLGARALGASLLALAVATLVTAATDEGGPWSLRLGMIAAIAPLAGMLGALAATQLAAARGELRALAAVGVDPLRATAGAATAGMIAGAIGPAIAATGLGDLAALFPRATVARSWIADGDGMRELALGVRIGAGGAITLETPERAALGALAASATPLAVVTLAVSAIACPLWIVATEGAAPARRAATLAAAAALAVGAFQAVAAGRAPPLALLAAPLALLADVALLRLGAARSDHRSIDSPQRG